MITQENIKVTAYKSDGFIGKYQKLIRDTVIANNLTSTVYYAMKPPTLKRATL